MGNKQTNKLNNISDHMFYSAKRLKQEYKQFLESDVNSSDSNHITGGISSAISSFTSFKKGSAHIDIYYEISNIDLLRNRYKVLKEFEKYVNLLKPEESGEKKNYDDYLFSNEEQKRAFLKRYVPIDKDFTLEELLDCLKIPNKIEWKKRNKYLNDKLFTLFDKHGIPNPKEAILNLKNLMLIPEARCTSDLRTFLEVLKPDIQKVLNQSDSNKELFIELRLKTSKQDHFKIREKECNLLKQYVKDICIINPYFKFSVDLEPGDKIKLYYGYIENDKKIIKEYEDTFNQDFIKNQEIDSIIKIEENLIPKNILNELNDKYFDIYYQHCKLIKDLPKLKHSYYQSFNVDQNNIFNNFIQTSITNFLLLRKNHDFGTYIID